MGAYSFMNELQFKRNGDWRRESLFSSASGSSIQELNDAWQTPIRSGFDKDLFNNRSCFQH
jgi:hypothetical protein